MIMIEIIMFIFLIRSNIDNMIVIKIIMFIFLHKKS